MNQNYGHPRSTSGPDSSLAVSSPCRYNEDRFLREGDAMQMQVCMGAMMQCSFGLAPSSLVVLPVHRTMTNMVPDANHGPRAPGQHHALRHVYLGGESHGGCRHSCGDGGTH